MAFWRREEFHTAEWRHMIRWNFNFKSQEEVSIYERGSAKVVVGGASPPRGGNLMSAGTFQHRSAAIGTKRRMAEVRAHVGGKICPSTAENVLKWPLRRRPAGARPLGMVGKSVFHY